MALRVLLADESTSIKKVMQLALQDFGVEVKSVPIGLDVVEVAKSFQPDIAFIDVLLQKRSGYEVCAEIRQDPELRHLPIVLMWSGFMDLDEKKLKLGQPNERLEKPFDASTLRDMTTRLVPRLKGSPVEQYLRFPHLPNFDEEAQKQSTDQKSNPPATDQQRPRPQQRSIPDVPPASFEPKAESRPQNPEDYSDFDQFDKIPLSSSSSSAPYDGASFDSLVTDLGGPPSAEEPKDEFDFDNFGDDLISSSDSDSTLVLPEEKNFDELSPEGMDFGDSEEGFTHVPLSALRQDGPTPAPAPLRDRIRESIATGALPDLQSPLMEDGSDDDDETPAWQRTSQEPSISRAKPYSIDENSGQESYSKTQDLAQHTSGAAQTSRPYDQADRSQRGSTQSRPRPQDHFQGSDLSQFKIDLPEVDLDEVPFDYDEDEAGPAGEPERLQRREPGSPPVAKPSVPLEALQAQIKEEVDKALPAQLGSQLKGLLKEELKADQLEATIRSIAAEAVEAAVWKVVPDIAERLVREELGKILKQIDESVGVKNDPS